MSVCKIEYDQKSDSFLAEMEIINGMKIRDAERLALFSECVEKASTIQGGYVKKIVWDAEMGAPDFSHGTIQYSPRPYIQGYGCDGTTDSNIHLIASLLCSKLGIDYVAAYVQAYNPDDDEINWIRQLPSDQSLLDETIVPGQAGPDELALILHDLYQINNRSLVCVLEAILAERNLLVADWT